MCEMVRWGHGASNCVGRGPWGGSGDVDLRDGAAPWLVGVTSWHRGIALSMTQDSSGHRVQRARYVYLSSVMSSIVECRGSQAKGGLKRVNNSQCSSPPLKHIPANTHNHCKHLAAAALT
jgi:hypothetical protein